MEKNKVEITKVVIKIGTVDVELTVEQARNLRNALNQLLGREPELIPHLRPIPGATVPGHVPLVEDHVV